MSARLTPCYDGGRHRWYWLDDWSGWERGRELVVRSKHRRCTRCGKMYWEAEVLDEQR